MKAWLNVVLYVAFFVWNSVSWAQASEPESIVPQTELGGSYDNFHQILKNPQAFSKYADNELVKEFLSFQKEIDEAWFRSGLQRKVRQLKQNQSPMTEDVLSEVVERAHQALQLKEKMEAWVGQKGRTSPEGLGTLAHYFERVYVPLLRVGIEGRVFLEIGSLELQAALWPAFTEPAILKEIEYEKSQLREPAGVMPPGSVGARDAAAPAAEFGEDINPLLDARLQEYASKLQEAANNTKRAAEIEQELAQIKNQRTGRRRSGSQTEVQRESARARAIARADRIRTLEAELSKTRPKNKKAQEQDVVRFFAEASKLTTLQLMLSQVHFYQHINDRPEPINLRGEAASCVQSYKELPSTLRFQVGSREERWLDKENFLVNSGLLFRETNENDFYESHRDGVEVEETPGGLESFNDFFLADIGRDPLQGYYTGMLPFYQMRVAQQGKLYTTGEKPRADWTDLRNPNSGQSFADLGAPAFDDLDHFHDVFEFLLPNAMSKLEPEDYDALQEVLSIYPKPMSPNADGSPPKYGEDGFFEYQEALEWVGVSPYLKKRLEAKNRSADKWIGVIPSEVFNIITSNDIKVDFPPFYGPEPYKQWALRLMYLALSSDDKGLSTVKYLCSPRRSTGTYTPYGVMGGMNQIDTSPRFKSSFCRQGSEAQILAKLLDALAPFEKRGPFVPPTLSYAQNLRTMWGDLRPLWEHLRDAGSLNYIEDEQGPVMNEFTFIRTQYKLNPWVMLRLSVLTKLHELRNRNPPARARGGRILSDTAAKAWHQRNRLIKALEQLPLAEEKKPVQPMYANFLYKKSDEGWKFWKSQEDKDLYKLWDVIEQRHHDGNTHIFKATSRAASMDYYSLLERMETRSLLTRQNVDATIRGYRLDQSGIDSKEMNELLDIVEEGDDAARFEVIRKIMESPGDFEKHQKILEEHLLTQGYEEDFDEPQKVKLAFLERDKQYKFPLMGQVLKIAAHNRSKDLIRSFNSLCRLKSEDPEDWDNLMSMTAQTQKMFNQTFGMDGIPPEVMKFYDRWRPEDKRDMQNMGLMIAGFVGLAMSGAACASGIGSVAGCPMAVTLFTVLAAGALSYSAADFIMNSLEQAMGREERMRLGKQFKELGYTDHESVQRRKGRGWGWVVFEVITAPTLFVPIVLATKVAARETITLAAKYAVRTGKYNRPGVDVVKTSWEAVELRSSLTALEFVDKPITVGNIFSRAFQKAARMVNPAAQWRYIKREFLDDVVVNVSRADLDKHTGQVLSKFFKGDKVAFSRFVEKEMNMKFRKIEAIIEKAKRTNNPKYLSKLQSKFQAFKFKPERIGHFESALMRDQRIVKSVINDLAKKEGPELAEYIARHADTLAPLLSEFGFFKRRILGYGYYYALSAGSPWAYANNFLIRPWATRPYVARIFSSREKLLYHNLRRQAQEGLELGSEMAMFDQVKLMQAHKAMVVKMAGHLGDSAESGARELADQLIVDMRTYQLNVSQQIAEKEIYQGRTIGQKLMVRVRAIADNRLGTRLTEEFVGNADVAARVKEIDQLIFSGTVDDMVQARKLLRSISPQELFDVKEYGETVDRVLRRMSNELKTIDQIADYVSFQAQHVKMLVMPPRTHQVIMY